MSTETIIEDMSEDISEEKLLDDMTKEIDNGEYENAINLIRIYLRDVKYYNDEYNYNIEDFFEEKLKLLMRIKDECLSNKKIKSAEYFCQELCKKVCIRMMKTAYKYSDKECIEIYKFISYYYNYSLNDRIYISEQEKVFLQNISKYLCITN